MIISSTTLSILVITALVVTIVAPIILVALFIKDRSQGKLW
jgi:hypothetical protein